MYVCGGTLRRPCVAVHYGLLWSLLLYFHLLNVALICFLMEINYWAHCFMLGLKLLMSIAVTRSGYALRSLDLYCLWGEDCDVTPPPLHLVKSENALYSLKKIQGILWKVAAPSKQPPVVIVQWGSGCEDVRNNPPLDMGECSCLEERRIRYV